MSVLQFTAEVGQAERRAKEQGLCASPDPRKYWDNQRALAALLNAGIGRDEPILDLGCRSGIILTWLSQLGYSKLYGCDLRLPLPPVREALRRRMWGTVVASARAAFRHRSRLRQASVEATGFAGATFAACTCMSVIEHGVVLDAFCAEMARILRPGGMLILSTDYWPTHVELSAEKRFAISHGPDRVFDEDGINDLCATAAACGLDLRGDLDLTVGEPVISVDGSEYTFILLTFERQAIHSAASDD